MRHSTGTPTKAEADRMSEIKDGPCVACHKLGIGSVYPEIHHLLSGNKRRGHRYTVGLCSYHHRGVLPDGHSHLSAAFWWGPSLADGSKPFRKQFGSDDQLLELQDELLGLAEPTGLAWLGELSA